MLNQLSAVFLKRWTTTAGTSEYRTNLISSRRINPGCEPIQQNIKIATEGQPVRVLGAWIGNGVDQATPWTPTIEKIAASLKKWEANHPTTEGRRLITQMIIGGMTQYLAKVQGIPETAELLTSRVSAKHTRRVSVKVWVVGLCSSGVCVGRIQRSQQR